MRCPECQTDNPDRAKFCLNCGAKLMASCPQCGTELPPQAKFCFECGMEVAAPPPTAPAPELVTERLRRLMPQEYAERLLAAQGQLAGERRIVTILFSDVKGSTAMAEKLDPEEVMEIMNEAFDVLIRPIYRHEGTLARLMGDAILAFFGAPIAHEDDPERAARAALEIVAGARQYAARLEQERGIAGFNVRVGINTGLVVVGEVGSDLRVEYTAMGDAINLAARLEQNAPPGGILISHDTYRHLRGVFDMQALQPITVKGKAEPVPVYLLEAEKPRAFRKGGRGVEGIETRMVGFEAELKSLQDAFYTVVGDGECRVVTIAGEAGVGKSRLLYEFELWAELQPETVHYFSARVDQQHQDLPYALLRDLFAFRFQIQESDPAELAREKLERGLGERAQAHIIGHLLGFDLSSSPHVQAIGEDARQLQDRAVLYIVEYFRALAAENPVLILLEDLHWADESSLDTLNRLARALVDQAMLVLCTARPALFERRPHWGEGQLFHRRLELSPLSRRDSRRLAEEILQKVEQIPDALRDLLVTTAEGNPFYMEELVKMLIEDGVIRKGEVSWQVDLARLTERRMPPTLTALLQARLDNLPLEHRTTLQQASVMGRLFWDTAAAYLSRAGPAKSDPEQTRVALSALRGREMVFRREASTFAGAREYIFKHATLREVTYAGILKKLRRAYHALVAEWMIEQGGERAGEVTGLIAGHLEWAGEAERALVYLRRAGEQAAARYAHAEAVSYFGRALALTAEADTARRYELLLAREKANGEQGARPAQEQDLALIAGLAAALSDPQRQAEVALRQSRYAESTGDYPAAIVAAQKALSLAQAAQDVGREAEGRLCWGGALWRQGQYESARAHFEQALALARTAGRPDLEARSLRGLGLVCFGLGDCAGARAYYEQALRIFRELGHRRGEGWALNSLGIACSDQSDYTGARDYFEQAGHIFHEIGDRRDEAIVVNNLGYFAHKLGELPKARTCFEQALRIRLEVGDREGEGSALDGLGRVCCSQGDYAGARDYHEQAWHIFREIGHRPNEGSSLTDLGQALAGLGELAEAAAAFRQALGIRRELGQHHTAMESLAGLAQVSLAQGNLSQAQSQVEEILRFLEDRNRGTPEGTEQPLRIDLVCYQILRANRDPRAREILTTAHTMLQEQAARIPDEETRRSFLENVPIHREIVGTFAALSEESNAQ